MIETSELVVERVAGVVGGRIVDNSGLASPETMAATGFASRRVASEASSLHSMSLRAARRALHGLDVSCISGVVAATFSGEDRFPALSIRLAGELGLSRDIPTLDLQMACSAYPYALYVAGRISSDTGGKVLVVDGDIQSRLVDPKDGATAPLFSDASTASVVSVDSSGTSMFGFMSRPSDALACPSSGPISMDGFKVFSFVASDVVEFLRRFGSDFDHFVPHRANMYMVRQLAKSLGLEDRLMVCAAEYANPGSCSVPLAIAAHGHAGRALVCGFGAGLSAAAGVVRLAEGVSHGVEDDPGA